MGSRLNPSSRELREYWRKLTEGATVDVPLEKQMWGEPQADIAATAADF